MKRYCIKLILLALAIPYIFVSCKKGADKDKEGMENVVMPVDVAKAEVESVMLYKEYPGILKANNKIDVVGRVSGFLKTINYNAGDIVQKGQVLFTIEDTQYRNAVQEAESALEKAKSNLEYAGKQYEAMQEAIKKDAVSRMELSQAKSNYDTAVSSVKDAQAQLETARTNLSYCVVRAPMRGQITASTCSAGTFIDGSVSPVTIATIYDVGQFYVDFFIDESSLLIMQTNNGNVMKVDKTSVPLSFTENLNHTYQGKLSYLAPDVDSSTGMINIRASISNPYGELRDGMYTKIQLPVKYETDAVLVKDASIGTDQLGKYVYLVNDSNKVVYNPIKTGDLVNDSMRVVTEGLKGGDLYVTKALLKVRNGKKVKPVLTP